MGIPKPPLTMPLRIARWAAVSTDSQAAPDKVSITIQLEKAAAVASSRGWVETAGPYIVTGESRTSKKNGGVERSPETGRQTTD